MFCVLELFTLVSLVSCAYAAKKTHKACILRQKSEYAGLARIVIQCTSITRYMMITPVDRNKFEVVPKMAVFYDKLGGIEMSLALVSALKPNKMIS